MTTTPIPPNWRGLCEELADSIELLLEMRPADAKPLSITEERYARALLAQPEPEVGPTDEELLELYRGPGTFSPVEFAREAIAADRARRPAPAPAAGEVGELLAWLRLTAGSDNSYSRVRLTRAADLLSQRHPSPVPVSVRLPQPEDCDAEGRCWWFNPGEPAMSNPHIATSSWGLCRMLNGKPMGTHWLSAHALPLPAREVK